MSEQREFVPALKYDWLTRFYDPLVELTTREAMFKRRLVKQAKIEPDHRVLDLGCGTATLTVRIKRMRPQAHVVGIDGDPKILAIARRKVADAGMDIDLDFGMAFDLPYPDGAFDRVLSSLLFHHLTREDKARSLREIKRVLRPGGELHIADWGKAKNIVMRAAFLVVQSLDGFRITSDNVNGLLPMFVADAGFERVTEPARFSTMLGSLSLYRAVKPGSPA